MLLSGEWFSARQFKEMGLALEVVSDEDLMAETTRRAQALAAFPTIALIKSKQLMKQPYRDAMRRANREVMDQFMTLLDHPACKEGIAAFQEKRPADFSGY